METIPEDEEIDLQPMSPVKKADAENREEIHVNVQKNAQKKKAKVLERIKKKEMMKRCPVKSCNWSGQYLKIHLNQSHGEKNSQGNSFSDKGDNFPAPSEQQRVQAALQQEEKIIESLEESLNSL